SPGRWQRRGFADSAPATRAVCSFPVAWSDLTGRRSEGVPGPHPPASMVHPEAAPCGASRCSPPELGQGPCDVEVVTGRAVIVVQKAVRGGKPAPVFHDVPVPPIWVSVRARSKPVAPTYDQAPTSSTSLGSM